MRDTVVRARSEPVLSILIFHRVLAAPDPMASGAVTEDEFARIAGIVRRNFSCFALSEAVARLDSGTPGHMLAITFDDGYSDNLDVALPVLRRYELPATIFVATSYLDGGIMWNDVVSESIARTGRSSLSHKLLDTATISLDGVEARQRARKKMIGALKYLPQSKRERLAGELSRQLEVTPRTDLMLSSTQLQTLAGDELIEIGGHTCSHPILACTDDATAAKEIGDGKKSLEKIIGQPVRGFAYPNGQPGKDYRPEHPRMAREAGYSYAVSTAWGAARPATDRFQLPRFTPWHRDTLKFGASLIRVARNG